ncbi:hypothetical protein K438DRAFT_1935015 [Mycena galopus ATCC 62051]|nr:hypothetical protein K438DRAFT_1935015 [Mycena galopus ATCC 62051]
MVETEGRRRGVARFIGGATPIQRAGKGTVRQTPGKAILSSTSCQENSGAREGDVYQRPGGLDPKRLAFGERQTINDKQAPDIVSAQRSSQKPSETSPPSCSILQRTVPGAEISGFNALRQGLACMRSPSAQRICCQFPERRSPRRGLGHRGRIPGAWDVGARYSFKYRARDLCRYSIKYRVIEGPSRIARRGRSRSSCSARYSSGFGEKKAPKDQLHQLLPAKIEALADIEPGRELLVTYVYPAAVYAERRSRRGGLFASAQGNTFHSIILGLGAASAVIIYAATHQSPSHTLRRVEDAINVVKEIVKYAKANCARDQIHTRLLETGGVEAWEEYLRNIRGILQSMNECAGKVKKIQTSTLLTIEAERQRQTCYERLNNWTNLNLRRPESDTNRNISMSVSQTRNEVQADVFK